MHVGRARAVTRGHVGAWRGAARLVRYAVSEELERSDRVSEEAQRVRQKELRHVAPRVSHSRRGVRMNRRDVARFGACVPTLNQKKPK